MRKMELEQKMREGGGGEEGRKRLQTNPWILKTARLAHMPERAHGDLMFGLLYSGSKRENLTGFPELYSNGHPILKFFSSFISPLPALRNNQNT